MVQPVVVDCEMKKHIQLQPYDAHRSVSHFQHRFCLKIHQTSFFHSAIQKRRRDAFHLPIHKSTQRTTGAKCVSDPRTLFNDLPAVWWWIQCNVRQFLLNSAKVNRETCIRRIRVTDNNPPTCCNSLYVGSVFLSLVSYTHMSKSKHTSFCALIQKEREKHESVHKM